MNVPERLWSALARLAALSFALVPRSARFAVAIRLARFLTPVVGRLLMRRPDRYFFSDLTEETLRTILRGMERSETRYDPTTICDSYEHIETARERGAVFVSGHFPLNALATRFFADQGLAPIIFRAFREADPRIWGTGVDADVLQPSPHILLQLRKRLRPGTVALMSIDRSEPFGRTVPVNTASGTVHLSTTIFDFAREARIALFFCCIRLDGSKTRMFVQRVANVEEFADLLQKQAEALISSRLTRIKPLPRP
jgi:lauroyl/myristoyl acyltransferase